MKEQTLNKRLKRDCQRVAFSVQINICDYGCYFESSVLRCQPLNRALYALVNLGSRKDAFKRSRGS
ncbi:hypothetical protein FKQ62_12575 [Vibrio sp. B1-2]|nr:hypothetical protein [Vibrio sp. B1-2]